MTNRNTDLLTSTLASFNYEYEEENGGGGGGSEDYNAVLTTTLTPSLSSTTARLGDLNSTSLYEESDVAEFRSLMETRRHESNDFRVLVVCLGLSIVSLGFLSNLLFSLLVIACPKRHRRGTKITSTQLVMLFMCLAYFMFLILYCIRLTLHLQTDSVSSNSILKFNIYDNMENWLYGGFMCKVISSAPIWTKLVSRFSLMLIVLRRLCCKLCFFVQASQDSPTEETEKMNNNEVNILERKGNKYDLHKRSVIRERSVRSRRLISLFCRVPWVFVLTCVVFCGSWLAILPLYMSFKLDTSTGICDSVYAFPDDVNKVAQIYFGYLVYGLAIPLGLTLMLLVVLFILNLGCISSYFSKNGSDESIFNSQNTDSSDTSPTQTAISAVKAGRYNKSGQQKIITQATKNKNNGNPSISSATASLDDDYNLLPFGRNSSSTYSSNSLLKIDSRLSDNNFLLWLVLVIQLATSLPPELYRYAQLKLNYADDRVLNEYLESVLVRPMQSARPYYAMQLLYVSEFALIPFMFLLFYKCTAAAVRRSRANMVTTKLVNGDNNNSLKSTGSVKNAMSKLFYDCELYKGDDDRMNNVHLATAHAQAVVNKRMMSNRSNSASSNNGLNQGSLNQARHQVNHQSRAKKLNQEKTGLASHQDTLLMPAASNHSYNPFPVTKKLLEANNLSNNSPKVQSISKSNKVQHQQPMYDFITSEDISGLDTSSAAHQQQQQQLVHIIQHPSWRINIKQQPQLGEQNESNGGASQQQHYVPSNSSHLPFTYCRK